MMLRPTIKSFSKRSLRTKRVATRNISTERVATKIVATKSFETFAAPVVRQYTKRSGLKIVQVSPTISLSPVQDSLNFWLPGSREGVTQQAGNGVGLVEMLKTFTRLKWINSDENKHGVAFIRDVLKGPSKHEYLLVTPSFPLTDKAFTRLMG